MTDGVEARQHYRHNLQLPLVIRCGRIYSGGQILHCLRCKGNVTSHVEEHIDNVRFLGWNVGRLLSFARLARID